MTGSWDHTCLSVVLLGVSIVLLHNAGTYSRAAVKILLSAQLLVCLDNLKPGGSLVVVVNITPHLTHLGTLCFLRGIFRRVVATKPVSCFKYRSSCYVTCFGYAPDRAAPVARSGEPEPEPAAAPSGGTPAGGGDDVLDEASRSGMAEIKRRILASLEALNSIDSDSTPSEHGWKDNGPAEREVLAPVCDIDAAELLRLHYHAMVRCCECAAPLHHSIAPTRFPAFCRIAVYLIRT